MVHAINYRISPYWNLNRGVFIPERLNLVCWWNILHIVTVWSFVSSSRCFFFGDISSKRNPAAYLKYISTLYYYYQKEYCMINNSESPTKTELPIVVNTPGWVKGMLLYIIISFFSLNICFLLLVWLWYVDMNAV